MIRYILFLFVFTIQFARAQSPNFIEKKLEDLASYSDYSRFIEEVNGESRLKEEYRFLDKINVYSVTYLSDGLKVKGFMAEPKAAGKYPAIIFNRGGNQEFGALSLFRGNWKYPAAYAFGKIAIEGFVVIGSNYRGNGGSEGKEEFGGADVNDILNLIPVIKADPKVDSSKVGMYGWSRGGTMTLRAITQTNTIKAVAIGGTPTDQALSLKNRPEMEQVYQELVPNFNQNKETELHLRSAIHHLKEFPKDVPFLIMHGSSDWRVKPEHSLLIALEMNKYRIPYRLILFEGGDHGIRNHREEVHQQVITWFKRFLVNNEPLPNMEFHGK